MSINPCETLRDAYNPAAGTVNGTWRSVVPVINDIINDANGALDDASDGLNSLIGDLEFGINNPAALINNVSSDIRSLLLLIFNAYRGGVMSLLQVIIFPYVLTAMKTIQKVVPFPGGAGAALRIAGIIVLAIIFGLIFMVFVMLQNVGNVFVQKKLLPMILIGLILFFISFVIFYLWKFKPIILHCGCDEPAWFQTCTPGTGSEASGNDEKCKNAKEAQKNIKNVLSEINKDLGFVADNITTLIPPLPTNISFGRVDKWGTLAPLPVGDLLPILTQADFDCEISAKEIEKAAKDFLTGGRDSKCKDQFGDQWFADPIFSQGTGSSDCFKCPNGYNRTLGDAVTTNKACSTFSNKTKVSKHSCAQYGSGFGVNINPVDSNFGKCEKCTAFNQECVGGCFNTTCKTCGTWNTTGGVCTNTTCKTCGKWNTTGGVCTNTTCKTCGTWNRIRTTCKSYNRECAYGVCVDTTCKDYNHENTTCKTCSVWNRECTPVVNTTCRTCSVWNRECTPVVNTTCKTCSVWNQNCTVPRTCIDTTCKNYDRPGTPGCHTNGPDGEASFQDGITDSCIYCPKRVHGTLGTSSERNILGTEGCETFARTETRNLT